MLEQILARRENIRREHEFLVRRPGTGWHPDDNHHPYKGGVMRLDQRPVAFVGDEEVIFVGDDAAMCLAIMVTYAEKHPLPLPLETDPQIRRTAEVAARAKMQADGTLRFRRGWWNDANYALQQEGVICCATHPEG